MTNQLRRTLALLALVIVTLAITACSGNPTAPSVTPTPTPTPVPTPVPTPTPTNTISWTSTVVDGQGTYAPQQSFRVMIPKGGTAIVRFKVKAEFATPPTGFVSLNFSPLISKDFNGQKVTQSVSLGKVDRPVITKSGDWEFVVTMTGVPCSQEFNPDGTPKGNPICQDHVDFLQLGMDGAPTVVTPAPIQFAELQ